MLGYHKYKIAISVAEEDVSVAQQIQQCLEDRKIKCYLYSDNPSIAAGESILEILLNIFSESRLILLIVSDVFKTKYWTGVERQIVHMYGKKYIPVSLNNCVLDGMDGYTGYLNWRENPAEIAGIIAKKIKEAQNGRLFLLKCAAIVSILSIACYCFIKLVPHTKPSNTMTVQDIGNIKSDSLLAKDGTGSCKTAEPQRSQPYRAPTEILKKKQKIDEDRILIPRGSFIMGNEGGLSGETPHQISVSSFYMSKTEVTVGQYREYCNSQHKSMPDLSDFRLTHHHPIINITWDEAKAYCSWKGGRLPREAEWEYAALAGQNTIYSGGNNAAMVAVYATNSGGNPDKSGKMRPNAWGLFDMSGNVAEWCADFYDSSFYARSGGWLNPHGAKSGMERVVRGGAWNSTLKPNNQLRVTRRSHAAPNARRTWIGFRLVWDIK
jgi:formylglycine-generating enzyme